MRIVIRKTKKTPISNKLLHCLSVKKLGKLLLVLYIEVHRLGT